MPPDALPPLTHHEILARVAPFARAGFAVDLPACDRAARRVVFRARALPPAESLPAGPVVERLELEDLGQDGLRLQRRIGTPIGEGRLEASGPDAAVLLEAVLEPPASSMFVSAGGGTWAALELRRIVRSAGPDPTPILRAARAELPGLALSMTVSGVAGYAAELMLMPRGGAVPAARSLPDDLLAVLGPGHGLLGVAPGGWRAQLALKGREPRRSAHARERLQAVLAHLAGTLARPPAGFAPTHRRARWRVALRRVSPWCVVLAVLATGIVASRAGPDANAWLALLANGSPPLLLMWLFLRREMPRLRRPRLPPDVPDNAWVASGAAGRSGAPSVTGPESPPCPHSANP